ncbi:glycosyltransferase family 4 protein [bacterium]|nr:glycosyltransferase family 4 protein [bacterium]
MGNTEKINVLHLNTAHTWRGGENQVFNLINGLKNYDIDNYLACPPGSPLFKKARNSDIEVISVNFKGELRLFPIKKLFSIVKKLDINIVHSHTSHALLFGCLLKLLHPRVKHVTTRRVDFHTHKNPVSSLKYRKRTDMIIAVSDGIKQVMISDGIDPHKIVVIRSGLDFTKLDNVSESCNLSDEFGIPEDNIILINVASLADHKAQKYLVDAMNTVIKEIPNISLLIVGEGKLYEPLENQIKKSGLQDYVRLTGFREDVPNLLKASDIFVTSSYLEGLGTSTIEAMRMKLPVIGTETGGIPEIIKDGENGFLVPPRDPGKLAEAIIKLAKNEVLRQQMGKKGYEISKDFSAEKMAEQNYLVYKKLINSGKIN